MKAPQFAKHLRIKTRYESDGTKRLGLVALVMRLPFNLNVSPPAVDKQQEKNVTKAIYCRLRIITPTQISLSTVWTLSDTL